MVRKHAMNEKPPSASFAPVDQGSLAYVIAGSGQSMILIHGSLLDRTLWDPQVMAFAQHHQVIRYDARGHGASQSGVAPYSHERDLLGLFEHLQIERGILIGLSMGARIALQFCLTWPERVQALVIASSGMDRFVYSLEIHACRTTMAEALARNDTDAAIEAFLDLWVVGPQRSRDRFSPQVLESVRTMAHRALAHPSLDGCELPFEPPIRTRLGLIDVPTLVINGEFDLPDMHAIANLLATHIPNVDRRLIADAGHLVNLEQPLRFNEAVLTFLEQLHAKPPADEQK